MVWALIVNDVRALVALLDRHGVAVGAAAAVAGLVLTLAYVVVTFILVGQTRRAHRDAIKPLISVRAIADPDLFQIFNLKIENVGGGPARKIILTVNNPPLHKVLDRLSLNGAFNTGISLLNPREHVEFFLVSAFDIPDELMDRPVEIKATFKDMNDRTHTDSFSLDFREFRNLTRVGEPSLVTIADSLKNLRSDFHSVIGSFSKLNVLVSTEREERRNANVTNLWAQIQFIKRADPVAGEKIEKCIASTFERINQTKKPPSADTKG